MATTHYNISGELTQELLAVGDGINVVSISLVNVHASTTCTVDLYIEKKLTGKFYFMKSLSLPVGVTLLLEKGDLKFNNNKPPDAASTKNNIISNIFFSTGNEPPINAKGTDPIK